MGLKQSLARATALVFGIVFGVFGLGITGVGVRLALVDGVGILPVILSVFGLPFFGVGVVVTYKAVTGQLQWYQGDSDIEVPMRRIG